MADKSVVLVCPECGADMTQLDTEAHSLTHFPEYLDPAKAGKGARSRQKMILSGGVSPEVYAKLHEEVLE